MVTVLGEILWIRRLVLDGDKVFWTLLKAAKKEMVNARLKLKAVISKFIIQYTDRSTVSNLKSAILYGIEKGLRQERERINEY